MQELAKILDDIEHEHPYHIPGRPETYSEYNDGWTDAIDRVRAELSKKSLKNLNHTRIPALPQNRL